MRLVNRLDRKNTRKNLGQALVEWALILPMFVVILFGIVDFGFFIFCHNTQQAATREGMRLAAYNDPTVTNDMIKQRIVATAPGLQIDPVADITTAVSMTPSGDIASGDPTITITVRRIHTFFGPIAWFGTDTWNTQTVMTCALITRFGADAVSFTPDELN